MTKGYPLPSVLKFSFDYFITKQLTQTLQASRASKIRGVLDLKNGFKFLVKADSDKNDKNIAFGLIIFLWVMKNS